MTGDTKNPSLRSNEPDNAQLPQYQYGEMHILDHLKELRWRLIWCAGAAAVGTCAALLFSNAIFRFIAAPYYKAFSGHTLIGTGPAEAFILKVKASIFAGILIAAPVIFYQLWRFVEPGLLEKEKRYALPFVLLSTVLFFMGAAFCFYIALPFAYNFFSFQYSSIGVTPTIKIEEHISFMIKTVVAFGLIFEMPIAAFIFGRAGLLSSGMLINGARYAVVIIFLLAAVLTPPDVITQILMAGPLLLLYGVSIAILKFTERKMEGQGSD